jgi:hypothetical protein
MPLFSVILDSSKAYVSNALHIAISRTWHVNVCAETHLEKHISAVPKLVFIYTLRENRRDSPNSQLHIVSFSQQYTTVMVTKTPVSK